MTKTTDDYQYVKKLDCELYRKVVKTASAISINHVLDLRVSADIEANVMHLIAEMSRGR